MDLQAGSKIGEYTLEAYLGGGSFGAVWRARGEAGERVAVKLLTGVLSSADTARMRGEVEMLAASAVASRSPHVVKVLGGGNQPLPHIVMEYVEGTDLASLLADGGVLPASRTIEVGVAIMDALRALNEAGIIHRDIKPANVMIDNQGLIKLADFGIAKIVGYESITMTGQAAMTMAYAAPEIWDEDSPFGRPSHRSDLYAAGIVLYQCLTGATPFKGNYGALYKAHAERAPDLCLLPPSTPSSLLALIERCLEKRQDDRPEGAVECLLMLGRAVVELEERSGGIPANEPSHFGPWQREAPHETQPWAWHCRHETTKELATVELHFAQSLDHGSELRRLVSASSALTPHGAERLIATSRLVLGPNESWHAAPQAPFAFWVAREDAAPEPAKSVSVAMLKLAVLSLAALLQASDRENVQLSLKSLVVASGGATYLPRPGLSKSGDYTHDRALAAFRTLPLQADALAFIAATHGFEDLIQRSRPNEEPTELAQERTELLNLSTLLVQPASFEAGQGMAKVAYGPVIAGLKRVRATSSIADYELALTNTGPASVPLHLTASSWQDQLQIRLPKEATVNPGSTQRLLVSISSRQKRWFGGRRRTGFSLTASYDGSGGGQPPLTVDGEFEDEPSRAPLVAGGGVFGIAALAVFAALALSGSGAGAPDPTPTALATETATATATATLVPTETPVPATATPILATPVPPTATRTPVIAPPTWTPVPLLPAATPVPPTPTRVLPPTATPRPTEVPIPTCVPDYGPLRGGPAGPAVKEGSGTGQCTVAR